MGQADHLWTNTNLSHSWKQCGEHCWPVTVLSNSELPLRWMSQYQPRTQSRKRTSQARISSSVTHCTLIKGLPKHLPTISTSVVSETCGQRWLQNNKWKIPEIPPKFYIAHCSGWHDEYLHHSTPYCLGQESCGSTLYMLLGISNLVAVFATGSSISLTVPALQRLQY